MTLRAPYQCVQRFDECASLVLAQLPHVRADEHRKREARAAAVAVRNVPIASYAMPRQLVLWRALRRPDNE